jgi:serine-type D-Ala-D-Ala carboxypeptidase/endopeptidase
LFAVLLAAGFLNAPNADALRGYLPAGSNAVIVVGMLEADGTRNYEVLSAPGAATSKVNAQSIFEIGSITKTFTAIALASMVRDGEVNLDDPIQKYLPAGVTAPSYNGRQITIADLADHHSGLPRMPPDLKFTDLHGIAEYTPAQLYAALSSYKLTRAPGATYEYSNWGVGLLGQLLANRAGMSYAELIQKNVIDPLGLHDTTIPAPNATAGALVPGFDPDGNPEPFMTWSDSLAGAGAVRSSVDDLLTLGAACMPNAHTPISADCAFAIQPRDDAGKQRAKVGLVWETEDQDGIIWHNGDTFGYHGFLGIDPVHHRVLAILANTGVFLDFVALKILDPARMLPPKPSPFPIAASTLSAYLGSYQLAVGSGATLAIERDGDGLRMIDAKQQHFTLSPTAADTFSTKENATLTFCRRDDGSIYALVINQYGKTDVAVRK